MTSEVIMSVRRGATWLGMFSALLGVAVALGAAPAAAEGESVRVRAPSSFNAGGSPGSVTVNVSKRADGCVTVRTALGVRLAGLTPDRVEVRVADDGDWRRVPVSAAAGGLVVAQRTTPEKSRLCERKSISSRYRLTLLAGAPGGQVTVVAEAYSAGGQLLGRGSDSARVGGRTAPSPSRTEPAAVPSGTPEATGEAAVATEGAAVATEEVAAALPEQRAAPDQSGGGLGIGAVVIIVGLVLVGIGAALLVMLVRRSRADRTEPATQLLPTGGGDAPIAQTIPMVRGAGPGGGIGPVVDRVVPPNTPGLVGPASAGADGLADGGDRTLILPTAGRTPPRRTRAVPPAPPGPAQPTAAPPAPAPQPPPPTAGGDPTLILPRNPERR
ncbi:hypothetical protein [Plantactinospora sp. CA-290183]|uniref:hypothetical protein n=1 Tax=Plantactinospora sp. CA-290183 TaxID=3240006 RepID=UPI003D936EAF